MVEWWNGGMRECGDGAMGECWNDGMME